MKYKVEDKVRIKSIDWYNENKNKFGKVWCANGHIPFDKDMSKYCGKVMTIFMLGQGIYTMVEDLEHYWTDEMIEGLVEEERKVEPKFKVGDIIISDVFSTEDDKGWKVIAVERTGYTLVSVNNPDLICDMDFKNEQYYKFVEEETIDLTSIVMQTVEEKTIQNALTYGYNLPKGYIFKDENGNEILTNKIILEKKNNYPETYEECCKVLGYSDNYDITVTTDVDNRLFNALYKLKVCRDAYWKIAGEKMGLGKPWEHNKFNNVFSISRMHDEMVTSYNLGGCFIFEFPTEEMRDAFKENFDKDLETCKELL